MKEVTIDCLTMGSEGFREGSLVGAVRQVVDEMQVGESIKIVEVKNWVVLARRSRSPVRPVVRAFRNALQQVETVNFCKYSTRNLGDSLVVTRLI